MDDKEEHKHKQAIATKPDPEETGDGSSTIISPESTREATDEQQKKSESTTKSAASKCAKCERRWARKGCTMSCCLTCCTDTDCATHKEVREKEKWREQVLAGTTPTQLKAKEIRAKAIPKGRFKETDFNFLGDTVLVWDTHQYMDNPMWREDAIRKSKKRKLRQLNNELANSSAASSSANDGIHSSNAAVGRKMSRKKRFEQTMEMLYQKSLST